MSLTIEPITGRIGAQVSGVKLTADLDEATFASLHQALLTHKVLFLRDQHLSDEEHEAFSRRFGEQVPHPTVRSAERSAAQPS